MSNAQYESDINEVLQLFRDLSYREQKKTFKQALRKSASIIAKEARKSLKRKMGAAASHNGRHGKLTKGIKTKVTRDFKTAKVHIMGDFRLKWFEMGTNNRYLRGTHGYRGKVTSTNFFREANNAKRREAEDSLIRNLTDAIIRINNSRR